MVIAISRESGCGGHEIALRVAKKLNIPFYDKVSLRTLAEQHGIEANLPEFKDETTSAWKGFVENRIVGRELLSSFVQELASKEDCVIVGRCSNLVLKNSDIDAVSFFIHADEDIKIARMMERKGLSVEAAKRRMSQIDADRKAYFERFVGKKWRSCRSYNFSLDSGYLGLNGCVDAIISLSENRLMVSKCFD